MNFGQRNKIKVGNGLTAISAIVLVMLIFFMLMAVVSKKDPQPAEKTEKVPFEPVLTVVVTQDNQYYLLPGETEKNKRGFDQIKDQIADKVSANVHPHLKIEGNRLAKYETIYNVAHLAEINAWEYRLFYTKDSNTPTD